MESIINLVTAIIGFLIAVIGCFQQNKNLGVSQSGKNNQTIVNERISTHGDNSNINIMQFQQAINQESNEIIAKEIKHKNFNRKVKKQKDDFTILTLIVAFIIAIIVIVYDFNGEVDIYDLKFISLTLIPKVMIQIIQVVSILSLTFSIIYIQLLVNYFRRYDFKVISKTNLTLILLFAIITVQGYIYYHISIEQLPIGFVNSNAYFIMSAILLVISLKCFVYLFYLVFLEIDLTYNRKYIIWILGSFLLIMGFAVFKKDVYILFSNVFLE